MNYIHYKLKKVFLNRIFVPFWKSRKERWVRRNKIIAELSEQYLEDMPFDFPENCVPERQPKEYIFSMWLQGEAGAPQIVRSCWESIRRQSSKQLVVLDADSVGKWIDLPDNFMERWRKGKIKACHVADLCRVELLWKYGGYWMDATDYMCHPMPEFIEREPFFMYMSDEGWNFYIQNCFIRAYAHHPLIGAWRNIIRRYWAHHARAFDYFLPHRLFRHMVLSDARVAELFGQMPKICHDVTQILWENYRDEAFDEKLFREITAEGAFQKLEYKSLSAQTPRPGSFADYVVNGTIGRG